MKKILYIMAMALAAAFTSCDDDFAYPPVSLGDVKGDGTKEAPYNVAGAIRAAARNGETSDEFVYVEGYVVSGSIDTSYGNASFDLYDTPDGSGSKFICYRIKGFNNQKFTDENQVKVGDKIIIYAPVINYKGNTPETGSGGYLYAINGEVGSDIPDAPSTPSTPAGEGTLESPYNIVKAIEVAKANGESSDVFYYVEGYVASGSIDTSYGNATWDLTDNQDGSGTKFIAYRVKDVDNQKFTDANKVKKGDKVVIYAPLINYKGNTPETGAGGYLISVNGGGSGTTPSEPGTPAGEGTATSPYNVSKAIEVAQANGETSETMVYVEGYVVSGSIDTGFGNATFDLYDDAQGTGAKFIAYRIKDFDNQKFTDANKIKIGDKIVVYGPVINYKGNTPETGSGAYLYSINGQTSGQTPGGDEPVNPGVGEGIGTEDAPFNVAAVIGGATGTDVWVKGYIVGWVDGQVLSSGAQFNGAAASKTNLLIADAANVTDVAQCVPVQLPSGSVREALNLQDHPENYQKEVVLKGNLERYFGTAGLKGVTAYKIDGQGGGGEEPNVPSGDAVYTGLVANMDDWTIANATLPDGLDYVWSWKTYNDSGYLNASAYKDGSAYAAEAYAYTTIDLSSCSSASLTFDHAAKFQTTLTSLCALVIREQGASQWTKLSIPTWPTAGSWTFVSSGAISLNAYAGKKVEIGFVYGSSESGADTWEIKNFIVSK